MMGLPRLKAWLMGHLAPLQGQNPRFHARWGRGLVEAGAPERAILLLHEALVHHPDDPWLHFHAGRAALVKSLVDQARVRFAHASALDPLEPSFRFALGNALREADRNAEAARAYREALRHAPDDPRILFNLGLAERALGARATARACFERVVSLRKRDARGWYMVGVCAFELRRYAEAGEALETAHRLDRKDIRVRYQLGLTFMALGDADEGKARLKDVIKRQPDFGPAHYALGRALLEQDPMRALKHFKEAVLGQPSVPRAHLDLARLHDRAQHLEDARREYTLYLRHFPEAPGGPIGRRLKAVEARVALLGLSRRDPMRPLAR